MAFDFTGYRLSDNKAVDILFYTSMLMMLDAGVMAAGGMINKNPEHTDTGIKLAVCGMTVAFGIGVTELYKKNNANKSEPVL